MRDTLSNAKISGITSTNHHSAVALLFALGLDDETFTEELLGLEQLVITKTEED
jgi:hypothetical protein